MNKSLRWIPPVLIMLSIGAASAGGCVHEAATLVDMNGPQPNGQPCSANTQCESGFCQTQEGVCCDSVCDQQCVSCLAERTGGENGTCGAIIAGQDPMGQCAAEDPATCGIGGTGCNGDPAAPGCNLYSSETECVPSTCNNGVQTNAWMCDGEGHCVESGTTQCGNYECDSAGTACLTSCGIHDDCVEGYYCDSPPNGTCAPAKANGEDCADPAECTSGYCADNNCCDAACDGDCRFCSDSGVCTFVPAGQDPGDECGDRSVCDGAGTCCSLVEVKLVELHIGSPDYVAIKNTGSCTLPLDPMALHFVDTIGTPWEYCLELPSQQLAPDETVYVVDTGATGTEIPCGVNLPFQVGGGGWVALYEGDCSSPVSSSDVLDLVAFSEGQLHPALPSGVTFSPAGLSGIGDQNANSYLRNTSYSGSPPSFVAADWEIGARTRP